MNNKPDERTIEMMNRETRYKYEVLEEWKLTRDGGLPLYLRKLNDHGKECWEMSSGKNQYGRIWGKLDEYFTEDMVREQIKINNGIVYEAKHSDDWYK